MSALTWIDELRSFDWQELAELEALGQWPRAVRQVLLALWSVVCLAVAHVATIPWERELTNVQTELSEQTQRLHSAQALLNTRVHAEEKLVAAEASLKSRLAQRVSQGQRPALVEALEALATTRGVHVEEIKLEAAVAQERLLELPMSVAVTGAFDSLVGFLDEMTALPALLSIGDFALMRGEGSQVIRANLRLSAWDIVAGERDLEVSSFEWINEQTEGWVSASRFARNPFWPNDAGPLEMTKGSSRHPLEQFDLADLTMVGTLERNGQRWALIRDVSSKVSRVGMGAHLGKHQGRIVSIERDRIELIERVPGESGWQERAAIIIREAISLELAAEGTQ